MESFLFYLFSGIAVLGALFVVVLSSPTRALLSLFLVMVSLAVLFTLLGAYFVAMVHIIVYAGAVLVLFLFVIMLQGFSAKTPSFFTRFSKVYEFFACFVVALLGIFLVSTISKSIPGVGHDVQGTVENVGSLLFSKYLLPFELISILLLLGIFAAIALAKEDRTT